MTILERLKQCMYGELKKGFSISWVTLMFSDPALEYGFARTGYITKVKPLSILFSAAAVYMFSYATHRQLLDVSVFNEHERRMNDIFGYMEFCGAVLSLTVALLALTLSKFPSFFRIRLFEAWITVFSLCGIFSVICINPHYMAIILRYDTDEIFPDVFKSDTTTALLLCVAVTVLQYVSPVRWHVKSLTFVSTFPVYGVASFVLGSRESEGGHQVGLLALISLSSCFSCRQSELRDREMFVTMVQERRLRAKAEFELSAQSESRQRKSEPTESVNESLPTTTDTGRLFQNPTGVSDDVLSKIRELGQREHWLIRNDDMCVTPRCLGKGGFALVFEGSMLGSPVAVKKAHTKRTELPKPDVNELRIIRLVRHPNIVLWHGAFVDTSTGSFALVFELIEGVTLSQLILGGRCEHPLDEPAGDRLIVDICRAVRYLHGQRPTIVHGDLKASNVMVEAMKDHYRAKITDFGLSRLMTRAAQPLGGTIRWMAPELFLNEGKPHATCDIFSIGRLMYFIITKQLPLAGFSPKEILSREYQGSPLALDWPVGPAHHAKYIARTCLARQPSLRPEMAEVLNMMSVLIVPRELCPDVDDVLSPDQEDARKVCRL